jgi:hypothetical protein
MHQRRTASRLLQTLTLVTHGLQRSLPNPDLDQQACRTLLHQLCDPDAILKDPEAQAIEEYLWRDRLFEPDCSGRDPQALDIQIGVALVERVKSLISVETPSTIHQGPATTGKGSATEGSVSL